MGDNDPDKEGLDKPRIGNLRNGTIDSKVDSTIHIDYYLVGGVLEAEETGIGKRLTLEGGIEKGGMSRIYKAMTDDGEVYAVKIMEKHDSEEGAKRFIREQNSMRELSDLVNIARVFGGGEKVMRDVNGRERDILFAIEEYIEHENLDKIRRPFHEVRKIIQQTARTLTEVHRRGFVHRDIKPSNILVDNKNIVRLVDFGLVKETRRRRSVEETVADFEGGTVVYMSPEQARGDLYDPTKNQDNKVLARTDVYSFGTTVVTLLTGRRPFYGSSQEIGDQVANKKDRFKIRDIDPAVPVKYSEIFERATEPRNAERPDMEDVAYEIDMFEATHDLTTEEVAEVLKQARWLWPWEKKDKEKLKEAIKSNEKAAWVSSGEKRAGYQKRVIEYFDLLVDLEKGQKKIEGASEEEQKKLEEEERKKAEERIPEDIQLAGRTIKRQFEMNIVEEEKPGLELEGWGVGRGKAHHCLDLVLDAKKLWLSYRLQDAEKLIRQAEREAGDLRNAWKNQLDPYINEMKKLIQASYVSEEARTIIREAKLRLDENNIPEMKKEFERVIGMLDKALDEILRGVNTTNPHYEYVRDCEAYQLNDMIEKKSDLVDLKYAIREMRRYRKDKRCKKSREQEKKAEEAINKIERARAISDEFTQLKRRFELEQIELENTEKYEEANKIYLVAQRNESVLGYGEAQQQLFQIGELIKAHLQGEEYAGFRKEIEEFAERVKRKSKDLENYETLEQKVGREIRPSFDKEIKPKFEQDEIPDGHVLRRFVDDVTNALSRLEDIDKDSVDPKKYDTIAQELKDFKEKLTNYQMTYIQGRFRSIVLCMKDLKGTASEAEIDGKRNEARDELQKVRRMLGLVTFGSFDKIEEGYKSMEEQLEEQYAYAKIVRKGREAIAEGKIDEAEIFFDMIAEGRRGDIEDYRLIIDLEKRKKDPKERGSAYFKRVGDITDESVASYKQIVGTYEKSDGKEPYDVIAMLGVIKANISFEEGYIKSLEEEIEGITRKRDGSLKDDAKDAVVKKLKELVGNVEACVEADGEIELTDNMKKRLGKAYHTAKFPEIGDRYLELDSKE